MEKREKLETAQVADQKKNEPKSRDPAQTIESADSDGDDSKMKDEVYDWDKDDIDDGQHARKVRKLTNNLLFNILIW